MNIGEKIRSARLDKDMTQSEVAGDKITRNMLSAIESGKSLPSFDTLYYIANKLDLPLSYLLSEEIDAFDYKKREYISRIRDAFSKKRYFECIMLIEKIGDVDDELSYILSHIYFELGASAAKNGSFVTAEKHLTLSSEYANKTVYDTSNIRYRIPLYMSFIKNVNAPLLDFDMDAFLNSMTESSDFEFFKYISNDWDFPYTNPLFKMHATAKIKMRERKYSDAIEILKEIAETKSAFEYNAYLMYSVYSDLDSCYKQLFDFENAYKYVGKRLSMLEGFKT